MSSDLIIIALFTILSAIWDIFNFGLIVKSLEVLIKSTQPETTRTQVFILLFKIGKFFGRILLTLIQIGFYVWLPTHIYDTYLATTRPPVLLTFGIIFIIDIFIKILVILFIRSIFGQYGFPEFCKSKLWKIFLFHMILYGVAISGAFLFYVILASNL